MIEQATSFTGTVGRHLLCRLSRLSPEGLKAEVARLVEQAQFEGVQLTGEGGLLPDMIRQAVEVALQGEMTEHLG
jgi:hypothetical protein